MAGKEGKVEIPLLLAREGRGMLPLGGSMWGSSEIAVLAICKS